MAPQWHQGAVTEALALALARTVRRVWALGRLNISVQRPSCPPGRGISATFLKARQLLSMHGLFSGTKVSAKGHVHLVAAFAPCRSLCDPRMYADFRMRCLVIAASRPRIHSQGGGVSALPHNSDPAKHSKNSMLWASADEGSGQNFAIWHVFTSKICYYKAWTGGLRPAEEYDCTQQFFHDGGTAIYHRCVGPAV